MHDYQTAFIRLALQNNVLKFGEFQLKSGRSSPYFFNAGLICTGAAIRQTGQAYAKALQHAGLPFDMLFGPAYKGIALATTLATSWHELNGGDLPVAYNRKETKTHGEGGVLVGAPVQGKVLIVDDVITAGTAVREVIDLIVAAGAQPAGVIVGLDRQERGAGERSAIQELEQEYGIPVVSIITLENLITYLAEQPSSGDLLSNMQAYRQKYGV